MTNLFDKVHTAGCITVLGAEFSCYFQPPWTNRTDVVMLSTCPLFHVALQMDLTDSGLHATKHETCRMQLHKDVASYKKLQFLVLQDRVPCASA